MRRYEQTELLTDWFINDDIRQSFLKMFRLLGRKQPT